MAAFLTALWTALSSVVTGFGGVLADAFDGAVGVVWDGANITVLGGILIAGVGASLIWLVVGLITNLISKIGKRGGSKKA